MSRSSHPEAKSSAEGELNPARSRFSAVVRWINPLPAVYPGEGAVVWLCFAANFLSITGIMLGRTSRDSLFLNFVGVQYLPYMYFANAVFLIVCSLGYTALAERVDRRRFLGGTSLLFAASLIASRIILHQGWRWFFAILYIQSQVIWYFSVMLFWTLAGDLFDTRQAKRLFPLFGVGALLGMVTVGFVSKPLVRAMGASNLLLVWAGLILAALLLGTAIYSRCGGSTSAPQDTTVAPVSTPSEWRILKDGFREITRERLLRSMAGYTFLLWTVYAVVDFCFNKTMRATYPDPNSLATFFGVFVGAQGLVSLLVQLFLTRPVISRLGVGSTIDFHPATLVLGTACMGLHYGYGSVLATKLSDAAMLYTFSDSSYQLLYNPLPPDHRAQVRGFIEGYIKPLSLAAAGIFVLLGEHYLRPLPLFGQTISTVQQLSWAAFAMAVIWLVIATGTRKGYLDALLRNLRIPDPSIRHRAAAALTRLKDAGSRSALLRTLQRAQPDVIVAALQFRESLDDDPAAPIIAQLLGHPDARVRATAVISLGNLSATGVGDRLIPLLDDPDERVRANAIEVLVLRKQSASASVSAPGVADRAKLDTLAQKLRPCLRDTSRRVRANAAVAISLLAGNGLNGDSLAAIREMAVGDAESRVAAVYAAGQLPGVGTLELLIQLLNDPELPIRIKAAHALGKAASPDAIPALVQALEGPAELRHEASRSIVKIGRANHVSEASRYIREELTKDSSASRPEMRGELAAVLGRLPVRPGEDSVIDTLITLLRDPERPVRWKAVKALERLSRTASLPAGARLALMEAGRVDLDDMRQALAYYEVLDNRNDTIRAESAVATDNLPFPDPRVPPQRDPRVESEQALVLAVREDYAMTEEHLVRLLAVFAGREPMREILENLRSGDSHLRSDALEALEAFPPAEITHELANLLDPAVSSQGRQTLLLDAVLIELVRFSGAWVRTCAANYLGHHPEMYARVNGSDLLLTLLNDRDSLVRQTALYAGWYACGEAWQARVQEALFSTDPQLRQAAERIQAEWNSRPECKSVAPADNAEPQSPPPAGSQQILEGKERKRPMLTVERVLFLKTAPLFSALGSDDLAALAEVASEQEYKTGEACIPYNRVPRHVYVIVRGSVEVFYLSGKRENKVAVLGERENFGEMAILDDEPRPHSATVRAAQPTLVLKIDRDSFREIILERPQIAFAIFKILVRRLRQRDLATADLVGLGAERNYA